MLTLLSLACTPAPAPVEVHPTTVSPARVGDPEATRQLFAERCTGCHATIDGIPMDDPMALVGAPGPRGLAWIEPGDPTASALYLKVTGAHREHGHTGEIMPPTPSGIVMPEDGAAILRAFIVDDDVVPEESRLGSDVDARSVIDRHCAECHDGTNQVDLSDPRSLAGVQSFILPYPLVEPGRPWRSSLYRMALDHEVSVFLGRVELDVPPRDLAALARFIAPDDR